MHDHADVGVAMPIPFTCPNCQRTGRLPDSFTGDRVKCPACQTISPVTIALEPEPAPPRRAPSPEVPVPPRPVKPRSVPSRARDEDDDETPAVPVALIVAGGAGAAVLAVAVGVVLILVMRPAPKPEADHDEVARAATTVAPAPPQEDAAAPAPAVVPTNAPGRPAVRPIPPATASGLTDVGAPATPAAPITTAATSPGPATESPAETVRRIKDASVFIKVRAGRVMGSGSGFVIRSEGNTLLVATNHHVISPHMEGPEEEAPASAAAIKPLVTAVFRSGQGPAVEQSLPATIIATDREGNRDLAILRVQGVRNPPRPIDLAQDTPLTETMPVLIYGFPFGNIEKMLDGSSKGNPAITINKGSVSSLRMNESNKVAYVQIDGSLNPGNSGGPVVDEHGRLVGVAVAQISNTTIGFAVPTHELTRMLEGRLGRLSLAFQAERSGSADLRVQAKVIDPLNQIRMVAFHYVTAVPGQGLPKPNADGTWPPLPGAARVNMAVNGPLAYAPFQVPLRGMRQLLVQASYMDSRGRTFYTSPVPYVVPTRPTGLAAVGAVSSPESKPKPTFGVLGPLVDVAKNCKTSRDDGSLTIEVPAGVHLLSAELDIKNSPMVLTDVDGDFTAQVKVAGAMLPGSEPARYRGKALPFTFQGAGIVLWQDKNNYLRFERSVGTAGNKLTMVNRLLLEACKNGKPAGHIYLNVPEGPLYLRVARANGGIQCMFGPDGKKWISFKTLAVAFPARAHVGLSASNASKETLPARFEEFVFSDPKKPAESAQP
jgi:S1-C subfamily serine protease/regulation of enolase protein 1 (concanavalin A-like superfamily)